MPLATEMEGQMYEDFEPYCKWVTDRTLEIDLKGFKKEQLKAKTNRGILTICGERPLDASNYKWSRFRKEFRLPKDCNVNETRAKFSRGILSIVVTKKAQSPENQADMKNSNVAVIEKHSIWGEKKRKGPASKVVVVTVILVLAFAFGTQIAQLLNKHPYNTASKDDVVNV